MFYRDNSVNHSNTISWNIYIQKVEKVIGSICLIVICSKMPEVEKPDISHITFCYQFFDNMFAFLTTKTLNSN